MYRTIQTETWDDAWFTNLVPNSKLIFLFLITNRRTTQCGAMEITIKQIQFETGLRLTQIAAGLDEMGDRVAWWPDQNLLIIKNFYRHQRANTGDKFDIAAKRAIEALPLFAQEWLYGVYPHLRPGKDTHPIPTPVAPHRDGVSEQNSNRTVTEQKTEAEIPSDDGKPPEPPPWESLPENGVAQQIVKAFCAAAQIPAPAAYPKAVGLAALLAKAGIKPEDIPSLYEFAAAGWDGTADLGRMLASVDRWRAKPVPIASKFPQKLPPELARRVSNWESERQANNQPVLPLPAPLQAAIDEHKQLQGMLR